MGKKQGGLLLERMESARERKKKKKGTNRQQWGIEIIEESQPLPEKELQAQPPEPAPKEKPTEEMPEIKEPLEDLMAQMMIFKSIKKN